MRNVIITATILCSLSAVSGANAAPIKAVLDACDRTANCNYAIDKNGNISGCSVNTSTCFECYNSTRECHQVGKSATGHGIKGRDPLGGVLSGTGIPKTKQAVPIIKPRPLVKKQGSPLAAKSVQLKPKEAFTSRRDSRR